MKHHPHESYGPNAAFYWLIHPPPRNETVFTHTLPYCSQSVPYTYLNLIFHCSPVRWVLIPLVRWRKEGSKRLSNFLTQASMRCWAQMWLSSPVFLHTPQLAVFHSWVAFSTSQSLHLFRSPANSHTGMAAPCPELFTRHSLSLADATIRLCGGWRARDHFVGEIVTVFLATLLLLSFPSVLYEWTSTLAENLKLPVMLSCLSWLIDEVNCLFFVVVLEIFILLIMQTMEVRKGT